MGIHQSRLLEPAMLNEFAETYLGVAKQLLGGASISDKAGLQSAFGKLGMSPDMVSKFAPIVTDYAGKAGGDQARNLLAGVLK